MADFVKVAKASDIPCGTARSFVVENEIVAVFNLNNNFYALRDQCSHMDLPISDGIITDSVVTCAYHGAEFDIETGNALCAPAYEPVESFEVKVQDDEIYVSVD
ncbi:MAG: non-heme iron oxygenase ferredoxin subunit [Candidatus Dadabacteria bacterium]|nr:non-heme iron oxygenase ferredoxin subunit [Candidatus Dadabacteria bacterium]NIS10313.1 non-heme iron oxygenase ferredoxin subunit [Candidatus Dadabacteria bacterium]NIV42971.1 Rieske 2Fe-2S domain-containing protein [Candidatus Dadabacteria bacterium]NIY23233.1 Rieske 2Fe-2S domain-containing protein [Candidatus Dadabacteria bacterium]